LSVIATDNSFFGHSAGFDTPISNGNSFFGANAGRSAPTGLNNSAFGRNAGVAIGDGEGVSLFGAFSATGSIGLVNATAIGRRALVTQNNSLVLGAINGSNGATADTNVGIGTTAPAHRLHVVGNGLFTDTLAAGTVNALDLFRLGGNRIIHGTGTSNLFVGVDSGLSITTGSSNAFFGTGSGADNLSGSDNVFFGVNTGRANTTGSDNSYFGRLAGRNKTTGNNNTGVGSGAAGNSNNGDNLTMIGAGADVGAAGLSFATAIGAGATVSTSNTVVLGRSTDTVIASKLRVTTLAVAAATHVCRDANNELSLCSSSIRYKTTISPFSRGLELLRGLRPVYFNWRSTGEPDMGLVAEEVAQVEPLLTTTNERGEIEGVKYDRIGVVAVNAIKEQQAEIDALKQQVAELKALACRNKKKAAICRR
jgi:hypothetical protein